SRSRGAPRRLPRARSSSTRSPICMGGPGPRSGRNSSRKACRRAKAKISSASTNPVQVLVSFALGQSVQKWKPPAGGGGRPLKTTERKIGRVFAALVLGAAAVALPVQAHHSFTIYNE